MTSFAPGSSSARHLLQGLALGLSCLCCTASVAQDNLIYTNDNTFFVPFNVGPSEAASIPSEVQLYVSGDRGHSWQLYQSQDPRTSNRFSFRAGVDGEFWFAVRTVSPGGSADKSEVKNAELLVVVDQQPPQIELAAKVSGDRQVAADWTLRDAHPTQAALKVECRESPTAEWVSMPIGSVTSNAYGDELRGTAAWVASGVGPMIEIRATATDKAGNSTVVERKTSANPHGLASAPQPNDPAMSVNDIPWPTPVGSPTATNPFVSTNRPLPSQLDNASAFAQYPSTNKPDGIGWRPSEGADQLIPPRAPVGTMSPAGSPATSTAQPQIAPFAYSRSERVSRSQRFQLEYEVEGASGVPIHRVEVWATSDSGQTWRHLGDDEDRVSPHLVSVPNDGLYGFRLLVQAQEGLPVRPPMSGDLPDVWVRVDSNVPAVRITSARYGRGPKLGQLEINWQASDGDLTESPVTILFGESPDGPWRIAADNLPNTGTFDWSVDDRVPRELYLRLEVQDRAGNIGNDTLRDSIRSDGLAPKGTIRAVRPATAEQPLELLPPQGG